jgi:cell pole-organizing protein PopZ
MDEILASIRRIIADDGGVSPPPRKPPCYSPNASIPFPPRL